MKWKKLCLKIVVSLAVIAMLAYAGDRAWKVLTDQSVVGESFYQIRSDKLVSSVRVVFLSDLHLATFGDDNRDLVERIGKLAPDLILIGGDMNVYGVDDYSVVLSLCRQLVEIADVYYGLGNHELTQIVTIGRQIYDDIAETGAILLNDIFKEVRVRDSTLYIGGLSESGGGIAAYSNDIIGRLAAKDGFKLLISHYPSNFDIIKHEEIDLVLSGHLHGGHVDLPYFDGLYSEDTGLFPDYTEGMFTYDDATMIVSRGLGNHSVIPRVNNPPELVIVDLYGSSNAYTMMRAMRADIGLQSQADVDDADASGGLLTGLMEQKKQDRDEANAAALTDGDEENTPVVSEDDALVATPTPTPAALSAPRQIDARRA